MFKTHTDFTDCYVTWECTTVCNYNCSYCWPSCHDGKYRWPSESQVKKLKKYIRNFSSGKLVTLDIMGGEPTLWPEFKEFCYDLSDIAEITFSSNGSRTARWWKNFDASVSHLLFSYHPEFADTAHYLEMLSEVHDRFRTQIIILYHPKFKDKCLDAFNQFQSSGLFVNCSLKQIHTYIDKFEYSESEINDLLNLSFHRTKFSLPTFNPNFYIDEVLTDPNKFIKNKNNKFLNWNCNLGQNYRYIRADGTVYGAACQTAPALGNIYHDEDIDSPSPTICKSSTCDCNTDLVLNNKNVVR